MPAPGGQLFYGSGDAHGGGHRPGAGWKIVRRRTGRAESWGIPSSVWMASRATVSGAAAGKRIRQRRFDPPDAERYAGAPGIKLWQAAPQLSQVSGKTVFQAVAMGDATAQAVLDFYVKALAVGLTTSSIPWTPTSFAWGGRHFRGRGSTDAPVGKGHGGPELCPPRPANDQAGLGAARQRCGAGRRCDAAPPTPLSACKLVERRA